LHWTGLTEIVTKQAVADPLWDDIILIIAQQQQQTVVFLECQMLVTVENCFTGGEFLQHLYIAKN